MLGDCLIEHTHVKQTALISHLRLTYIPCGVKYKSKIYFCFTFVLPVVSRKYWDSLYSIRKRKEAAVN